MYRRTVRLALLFPLLCALSCLPARATVVRFQVSLGDTPAGDIYIKLFDAEAPVTVANFLNYIDDGNGKRRYDGTFIHRSMPGFVLQGGGYSYDPAQGTFGTAASTPHIPQDDPIVNEFDFSRSNLRGTLAMAKSPSGPDTATSEWFFNLADNSANLDYQNGGFTVFGRVLGPGMDLVDSIAALPVTAEDPPFTDLPVTGYTAGDPILASNLVILSRAEVVQAVQPAMQDFGPTALGTVATATVTLRNLTDSPMTLGTIGANALTAPFSIGNDTCSGAVLAVTDSCVLTIDYQPQAAGDHEATLNVTTDSSELGSFSVALRGTAAAQAATLAHDAPSGLDFGDLGAGAQRQLNLTLSNTGLDPLTLNHIAFTGTGAGHFSVGGNCQTLNFGDSCSETLTFAPTGAGPVNVQLEIRSDDPAQPLITIPVLATASSDNDGVPDTVEAAGPNNGDGNRDGIADDQQDNVASLPDTAGVYVTLEADAGTRLRSVDVQQSPAPATTPVAARDSATLEFPNGFFSFTLEGIAAGGAATVTLHLPAGQSTSSYFKYGRLPNDFFLVPEHWYQFDYDGQTGAEIQGNRVILHFIDGGRGDNDQSANGRIVDPGGPAVLTTDDSSSGGGCSLQRGNSSRHLPLEWLLVALFVAMIRIGHPERPDKKRLDEADVTVGKTAAGRSGRPGAALVQAGS